MAAAGGGGGGEQGTLPMPPVTSGASDLPACGPHPVLPTGCSLGSFCRNPAVPRTGQAGAPSQGFRGLAAGKHAEGPRASWNPPLYPECAFGPAGPSSESDASSSTRAINTSQRDHAKEGGGWALWVAQRRAVRPLATGSQDSQPPTPEARATAAICDAEGVPKGPGGPAGMWAKTRCGRGERGCGRGPCPSGPWPGQVRDRSHAWRGGGDRPQVRHGKTVVSRASCSGRHSRTRGTPAARPSPQGEEAAQTVLGTNTTEGPRQAAGPSSRQAPESNGPACGHTVVHRGQRADPTAPSLSGPAWPRGATRAIHPGHRPD